MFRKNRKTVIALCTALSLAASPAMAFGPWDGCTTEESKQYPWLCKIF